MLEAARLAGALVRLRLNRRRRSTGRARGGASRSARTRQACPRPPTGRASSRGEVYCRLYRRLHGLPAVAPALRQRLRPAPGPTRRGRRRRDLLRRAPQRGRRRACSGTASRPATTSSSSDVVAAMLAAEPAISVEGHRVDRSVQHRNRHRDRVLDLVADLARSGPGLRRPSSRPRGPARSNGSRWIRPRTGHARLVAGDEARRRARGHARLGDAKAQLGQSRSIASARPMTT